MLAFFVFKRERWRQRWRDTARAEKERDTQRRREGETQGAAPRPPPHTHRKRQREGGSGAELEKGGQGGHETLPPPRSAPHPEKGGLPRRSQPSPGLRPGTGGSPTGQCPVITPSSHLLGDRPPLGPSLRRRWVHVGSPEVPGVAWAVPLPIGLNINTQPARGTASCKHKTV